MTPDEKRRALRWQVWVARWRRHGEFRIHCRNCDAQYLAKPAPFSSAAKRVRKGMILAGFVDSCAACSEFR